uniref:general transcription factor IIE subunit 2-like n=1 Tax=Erigeron canadensis TaxID=72917 RepID=UPI001CB93132|nr:general transcription factor IIE subunit 2-like [Erigeron canadensis]XP_043613614.1 general transcription factor IIE subunit 2-like [Erigeron canadensis]
MGTLQERLILFNKQQEKCQLDACLVSNIKTATTTTRPASNNSSLSKAPVPGAKFSEETERWQRILRIRKSPVGVQIKIVIDKLYESRKSFTAEEITKATDVDVKGNKEVFDSLKNNPKVNYDGTRFSYKPTHTVNEDKNALLRLIKEKCVEGVEGIAVAELKDAYPNVMEDLKALKADKQIWLLSNLDSRQEIAYPNNCEKDIIKVHDELKKLFRGIELPQDMEGIVEDLEKHRIKPMTNIKKRREMAQNCNVSKTKTEKIKKKKTGISKRTKLTNTHLPELIDRLKQENFT